MPNIKHVSRTSHQDGIRVFGSLYLYKASIPWEHIFTEKLTRVITKWFIEIKSFWSQFEMFRKNSLSMWMLVRKIRLMTFQKMVSFIQHNWSPTSQICHQHKLSLTSVTDIDVALYLHKSPNLSPTSVVYITLSTIQDAINIASATKSELFPYKKGTYM